MDETALPGGITIYKFRIQPQDVDFQSQVTMAAFVNILLTAAGFNADQNGFGIRKLNSQQSTWVLLRLAVELKQFPRQYEDIQVETWIEEIGHIATTRNFRVLNDKDQVIGYACSNWAMIDVNTRRAQNLDLLEGIHRFESKVTVPIDKPAKLDSFEGELNDTVKSKYSDIDINRHTSSMKYIEWIANCINIDTYKEKQIKRFEINYLNEVIFGDEVSIFATEFAKNDFRFEMKKDGKACCKARMTFS